METAEMNMTQVKMQRYPVYKDSGVEWLGEVPKEWTITRVKNIFRLVIAPATKNNNFELLSVYTDIGVKPRRELEERGNKASTTDGYLHVKIGDIVVNKLLAWMGAIGISNYTGVTSPAYDILRAKENVEPHFYHYLFRSETCSSELKKHSRGIMDMRLRLYFDKFSDVLVPFPSFDTQKRIVWFLNTKTAQIDQAIAQKERQIELLKERRQILIHKAVTRGLNPNVKMKDSGVEWIGEIPEHWEVKRIKTLSRVKRGASPRPIDDPRYFNEDGEFAWVRIADVSANDHYLTNTVQQLSKLGSSLSVKIFPNELFVSIAGTVGKPMISKIKCCIHDGFVYFPDLKINIEYLYRIFETGQPYLGLGKHGTQLNLNTETIGSIYMPIPPDDEQSSIVNHVENTCQKLNKTISLKQQEIEKLKEYKATLINAAVTGKIKV
jgi:type I restriction enzyme S subunit